MADVKGVITKKIGPLPVLAWVAIGAAIILVIRLRSGSRGGGAASPLGSPTDTGGVSPQTLDFQQSLLDLASSFRTQQQLPANPPTAGVSTVTPTTDTASLAPAPLANPSGGPIATTKTSVGPGVSVPTVSIPAVTYAGPPVLGLPGFAPAQTAQPVNGIPIAFEAHPAAPIVGAPTAPIPVPSLPSRVPGFPSAAEVAEFYG